MEFKVSDIFAITILEPIIDNVALKLKLEKFASYYLKKVEYIVNNYTEMGFYF